MEITQTLEEQTTSTNLRQVRSVVRSVGEIIGCQSLDVNHWMPIIGWQSLDEIISLTNDNLMLQQAAVGFIRGGGDKL